MSNSLLILSSKIAHYKKLIVHLQMCKKNQYSINVFSINVFLKLIWMKFLTDLSSLVIRALAFTCKVYQLESSYTQVCINHTQCLQQVTCSSIHVTNRRGEGGVISTLIICTESLRNLGRVALEESEYLRKARVSYICIIDLSRCLNHAQITHSHD